MLRIDRRRHKKTGHSARPLALPRLLARAEFLWRFALRTNLCEVVIRRQQLIRESIS